MAGSARPLLAIASLLVIATLTYGLTTGGTVDWASIPTPPKFTNAPNRQHTVYFTIENSMYNNERGMEDATRLLTRELKCVADAIPPPKYTWLKNGKPLEIDMYPKKIVQTPREGTITLSNLDRDDAGEYVCQASNGNGTAVQVPIQLVHTYINHFDKVEPEIIKVHLGDPFYRNCTPPASIPPPRVYWIMMGDGPGDLNSINGSHISSNPEGTLFFQYVALEDQHRYKYYACTAENTELKDYKFGEKFMLEVDNKTKRKALTPPISPTEQYVNQSSPVALQGTTHKLHCFFSGLPAPRPDWLHNGRKIKQDGDNNGGFRFENHGKTLAFNVTDDKQGLYKCVFPSQNDIDREFTVLVEAAPYWPNGPPPNTNTSEGETVEFDCATLGKPKPVVTFYKNGVELTTPPPSGKKNEYVVTGNRLTIYNVKKGQHGEGDNAVYQCKAENKHGYVWTNFYLNLLAFKPQLLEEPGEIEAVEGKDVILTCKFFGSPNAQIRWEGSGLSSIEHNPVPADPHGVGKLVIPKASVKSEGEYKCIGSNKYGEAEGAAQILIRKATFLTPFEASEEIRVAGGEIRLPCEAQADDRLDVSYEWRVDGNPLPQTHVDSGHYTVGEDHTLIVSNPAQYDTAEYTCIAKTKLDEAVKKIKINIRDVPYPVMSAAVDSCESDARTADIIYEHMENEHSVSPVKEFWVQYQIDSDAEGGQWRTHPIPITLEKGRETIENGMRSSSGKFTISLQPFGKYTFRVIARNLVGDSSPVKAKGTCLTPPQLPDRNPIDVEAKGASPENLVVSWRPMQREEWNGANFHYKIKYRPKDDPSAEWKEMDVNDPYASKFTIDLGEDDARPFQPYLVQVQAVNQLGESSVTPEMIEGYTGEGIPSAVVDGFVLEDKSGTSATFKWKPVDPAGANGNFTGYKIHYWTEEGDEEDDYDYEEDGEKETLFWRRRRSVSRVKRATEDADDLPSNGKKKTAVFGTQATRGTVEDLTPATVNKAYITVMNGAHEGPKSQTISFRTDEGVPSPVRAMSAYPMNVRQGDNKAVVVVKWGRPRHTNGRLTGYHVEWCRTQGRHRSGDCKDRIVPLKQRELRITGLEHETNYRFIVRATTTAGEGDPNSDDAKTLPEITASGVEPEVPSAQIGQIGDTAFNVSFVPGDFDDESRKPVGNYLAVQYKEADGDEWKERLGNDESLTVAIDELTPGTKYDVRTVAVERESTGEEHRSYSAVQSVTTTGRSNSMIVIDEKKESTEETPRSAKLWLLLLILLILLLLLIICCIICVACRQRGQNYPVSQREREQGREPILGKQHFGEYKNDDDEKRSLTGSKAESETDSMAEYGDADPGRFTEDGSFIGQYVPNKTLIAQGEPTKYEGSTSTFV